MSPPYLLSQEEYDAALSQGHTAIHLTQRKGSSLFSIEVGNLRAMEEALVVFSYVRLLNSVAGSLEFEHIATWVPPYTSGGASAAAVSPDDLTYSTKVGYSLSYKIKLHSSRGFRSIESPSAVTITEEGPDLRVVTLAESGVRAYVCICRLKGCNEVVEAPNARLCWFTALCSSAGTCYIFVSYQQQQL